jgi:murein DD-endopeptidase MepM/ murein hydrolase activator NlpD
MRPPRLGRALAAFLLLAATAEAQAYKQVGQLTIQVDSTRAFPGGLFVVQLQSRHPLGTLMVGLDGRKHPALASRGSLRALVPIPLDSPPGPRLLGVELYGRRGRQRVTLEASVAPRAYPPRTTVIPPEKLALLKQPQVLRESRRLMLALRTTTPAALWSGAFAAPVNAAGYGFGALQSYVAASQVEQLSDGTFGEQHRGIDYPVPLGTLVQAPAAGTVVFAGALTVLGNAVVLDHGQGVVSLVCHLGRVEVRDGERIEARAALGTSGSSGIAASPLVHWGVYIHGIAVDPGLLAAGLE